MKVATQQVDGADALRAVADGKHVEMIWRKGERLVLSDFGERCRDAMNIGEAFLVIETDENCDSAADEPKNCETAAPTLEGIIKQLEEDVKTDVVTDQEIEKSGPITVVIPNSKKEDKRRQSKLDDERIIALRKAGMSELNIAMELDTTQPTIHAHVTKLRKAGKL